MSDRNTPTDLQALWDELTQPDEVRRKRIRKQRFDERAEQYARPQKQDETYSEEDVFRLLTFILADERYGLDVHVVTGVRPAEKITRVPSIPAFYRGVINVRGQIVSVLDLRRFFSLSPSDASQFEMVLVQAHDLTIAILADHVQEVQQIPRDIVQTVDMRYAHGVTPNHLVILDIDALLTDERLIIGGESDR